MAKKATIRQGPRSLRGEISPNVRSTTRQDLTKACTEAEKRTAAKAVEFVDRISSSEKWALEDWVELAALAEMGRLFHEVRLAFTEIDEVDKVAVSRDEAEEE